MGLNFEVKIEGLQKLQRNLDSIRKGLGGQAVAAALNKTAMKARTTMKKEIASEYAIPATAVLQRLRVVKASAKSGRLQSVLTVEPRVRQSFNARRFMKNAGAVKGAIGRGKRAPRPLFQVKKSGSRKTIRNAFLGNDGRTVFRRTGKSRKSIKAVQSIGVPQAFASKRINSRVIARIRKELPVEIDRAVAQVLRRLRK